MVAHTVFRKKVLTVDVDPKFFLYALYFPQPKFLEFLVKSPSHTHIYIFVLFLLTPFLRLRLPLIFDVTKSTLKKFFCAPRKSFLMKLRSNFPKNQKLSKVPPLMFLALWDKNFRWNMPPLWKIQAPKVFYILPTPTHFQKANTKTFCDAPPPPPQLFVNALKFCWYAGRKFSQYPLCKNQKFQIEFLQLLACLTG